MYACFFHLYFQNCIVNGGGPFVLTICGVNACVIGVVRVESKNNNL